MKLTKTKLKQLIHEEIKNALQEDSLGPPAAATSMPPGPGTSPCPPGEEHVGTLENGDPMCVPEGRDPLAGQLAE